MITLLGKAISRSARCLWALEEVGVQYEHKPLDYATGDAKTPEFTAINPGAKIPALIDGDVAMFESLAINLYLAQTYGKGALWPDDAAGQAQCLQWTLFSVTEAEPPGSTRLVQFIFKSKEERSQEVIDAAAERSKAPLNTLETTLQSQSYLAGDSFTVADLNVACSVEYFVRTNFDLSPWPKVKDWIARCMDRPAFQAMTAIKAKEAA
ncbi:MAG: glutathione S-transferase family protein [Rhodospirillaceae bacterium]|jgi:glutathione S-transferase|nr:glutathione S-transferase family protein [Rhodospirillaceae bacterium]MBT5567306.1 glutathione S-transferase family protein [Rhodospirillaceae bacterium]MBT6091185.1 glutathione S-transferase family protein [Rhodospirillaceae bacterium]MBT6959560.1 glutathione S-transferase family protein [Rhodospirillaceae bacterium]MBT7449653.1 glutathione S-transferase family protein [Rhodospirillaceae bacterium]